MIPGRIFQRLITVAVPIQNSKFLKSRHFLDNVDQPTPTCVCQADYGTAQKYWNFLNFESEGEIDQTLVEVRVVNVAKSP